MVDEFSAFARMPNPRVESDDLRRMRAARTFLNGRVAHPEFVFEDHLPDQPSAWTVRPEICVSCKPVTNIVKNATEGIEAQTSESSFEGNISVTLSVVGDSAIIDVIDNGKGFPKDNRQRLLEPLYDDSIGRDRPRASDRRQDPG